ncbi:hypothetical protein FXO38_07014 [Capsicum annuum]|nr:hypothetical protein FXO38_07014 [Capsicum annuum]
MLVFAQVLEFQSNPDIGFSTYLRLLPMILCIWVSSNPAHYLTLDKIWFTDMPPITSSQILNDDDILSANVFYLTCLQILSVDDILTPIFNTDDILDASVCYLILNDDDVLHASVYYLACHQILNDDDILDANICYLACPQILNDDISMPAYAISHIKRY